MWHTSLRSPASFGACHRFQLGTIINEFLPNDYRVLKVMAIFDNRARRKFRSMSADEKQAKWLDSVEPIDSIGSSSPVTSAALPFFNLKSNSWLRGWITFDEVLRTTFFHTNNSAVNSSDLTRTKCPYGLHFVGSCRWALEKHDTMVRKEDFI